MKVRTVYTWCDNRIEPCDVGIFYMDILSLYLLKGYPSNIRKEFLLADLKKLGYWLGNEREVQSRYINKEELEEYFTHVV